MQVSEEPEGHVHLLWGGPHCGLDQGQIITPVYVGSLMTLNPLM